MKCMRVESLHPCPSGGFYHFYETAVKSNYLKPVAKEAPKAIDAGKIMTEWRNRTSSLQYADLALSLGVLTSSVISIGAAWSPKFNAWAFPMKDGSGETIGIRLRNETGFKWAVTGSRQGIFIPEPDVKPERCAYLPEGPTDTMALLSMGLYAIGRPTCLTGGEHIKAALARLRISQVVVVADNDEMKTLGPREGRPGIEGAIKLKKDLGLTSVIWHPSGRIKDAREFYQRGGSRLVIESQIKNRVWNKS